MLMITRKTRNILDDKIEGFLEEVLMEHLSEVSKLDEVKELTIQSNELKGKAREILTNSVSAKAYDEFEEFQEKIEEIESQISLEEVRFIYQMGIQDGVRLSQKHYSIINHE